jgi:hypothetical protein
MAASSAVVHAEALDEAHRAIDACIEDGQVTGLNVIGFGEVTLAVAWPAEAPTLVFKRLPPFRNDAAAEGYRALLYDYIATLAERGVSVVPTDLRTFAHEHWGVVGYLVQPAIPRSRLLISRCQFDEAITESYVDRVIDLVIAAVDHQVGLDAQLPNWALDEDGSLSMLDVSTPMLRDESGNDRLPMRIFLAGYPAVVRAPLGRWVVPSVLDAYHKPEGVLLDVATQMVRQGMHAQLPHFVAAVNARLGCGMTERAVHDNHRRDVRLWALMQRMRRIDRRWQRSVRRRPYPSLTVPRYEYGSDYSPVSDPTEGNS